MHDPRQSAGRGAERQPEAGLDGPEAAEKANPEGASSARRTLSHEIPDPDAPQLGVEDLLEDDDESMIHRFDFGLQVAPPPGAPSTRINSPAASKYETHTPRYEPASRPESTPRYEPPVQRREPSAPRYEAPATRPNPPVQRPQPPAVKGASTGAPREPDEAINAQLELEDRFDWAFARGQHFAEPATQRESEGASSDAMYEEFEELIEETRPVQEPEDPRIDALQDDAWPEIPQGRFVVRREVEPPELLGSSGLGKRKGGAARKSGRKGVPPWLSIALILVLILAGVAVWVLLRSLDAERTVSTVEDELEELAESPSTQVDVGPTPVGDTGPDFEVPDLDVVASRVPEQDPIPADAAASPLAVAVSKPTAAKPAQPDRSATPSGASIPADAGTVPGAASAEATDPKESKRAWEPLVRGVDLPGWQSRNRDGWSVRDDLLTVRPPPDAKSATVLVTDRKYRNLAFTFKAKPLNAGTVFGVLTRAQSGAAIRLEFSKGKGTLRAAEASMAVDWEWKPNVWHQVALIAMDKNVLVYIDRRKVGTLSDVKVDAAGRLGVYCSEGQIELRAVYAQPLD